MLCCASLVPRPSAGPCSAALRASLRSASPCGAALRRVTFWLLHATMCRAPPCCCAIVAPHGLALCSFAPCSVAPCSAIPCSALPRSFSSRCASPCDASPRCCVLRFCARTTPRRASPCRAAPCGVNGVPCLSSIVSLMRTTLLRGFSAVLFRCAACTIALLPRGFFWRCATTSRDSAASAAPASPYFPFAFGSRGEGLGVVPLFCSSLQRALLLCALLCFASLLCMFFRRLFASLLCCVSVGSPLCWVGPFVAWAFRRLLVLSSGCLGLTPWPSFFAVSDLSWCD